SAIIRASWPPPITARVGASTRRTLGGAVLGLEPQSLPADRGDQPRVPAVVTELAAYPAEVDVDGLRRGPEGRVPHVAHQLVAGDDRACALHQHQHQVELLAGQDDLLGPTPRTTRVGIEPDVLHLDHLPTV